MNIIDFTKNGGYRLKQFTFRKMQEAYIQILKMFVAFCNVPEVGKFIVSGCKIDGANITSGYLYIDGELCYFEQIEGTDATKIKKNIVIQSLGFKNGNNENVFRFTNAVVDETTGTPLADFVRVSPVFDADYTHTDNNFSDIDLAHLDSIEPGAQVNIKPSWTAAAGTAQEILNKPNTLPLMVGYAQLGNLGGDDDTRTIWLPQSAGTTSYIAICTLVSQGDIIYDNDIIFAVFDKQFSSFKITTHEIGGGNQNLRLDYAIFLL